MRTKSVKRQQGLEQHLIPSDVRKDIFMMYTFVKLRFYLCKLYSVATMILSLFPF